MQALQRFSPGSETNARCDRHDLLPWLIIRGQANSTASETYIKRVATTVGERLAYPKKSGIKTHLRPLLETEQLKLKAASTSPGSPAPRNLK
jgi:hypothetical protein